MTEIWFIRHGETDWNRQHRLQGWQDTPLNAAGAAQARLLAKRLDADARRTPFSALYTSDLRRAHATAQAVSEALGLPLRVEPGIKERRFGVLEGLEMDRVDALQPEAAAVWKSRDPARALEGGESLAQLHERVVAAMENIVQRHLGERVLAVTHGGVLDSVWRHASGEPLHTPRRVPLRNVSINRVGWDGAGWQVLDWGDVAHTESAQARDDFV